LKWPNRNRPAPLRRLAATFLATAGLCCAGARADIYVVVQAANPQQSLTLRETVDLFMGHARTFGNGDYALAFDLPRDSAVRGTFYRVLTGMSQAQVNSYWSRLMFAGQTMPPQSLPSEAAMSAIVKRNPSAIGYLSKEPTDPMLRTVLVLKEKN
jgi:hypothetical protein